MRTHTENEMNINAVRERKYQPFESPALQPDSLPSEPPGLSVFSGSLGWFILLFLKCMTIGL